MQLQSFYLYLILFFSGAAGLGYEIVWTRMLSSVLGHEILSALAVVAAFFSGLALGSWALDHSVSSSRHPGRWYAGLELVTGLWSLVLGITFPWVSLFATGLIGVAPAELRHWAVAFLLPFMVLLPATFAMGGTMPAMERLFSRLRRDGHAVGGLYAGNTFGAVAGTLAATFWITPALGFRNTHVILAAVNFFCAAGALLVAARDEGRLVSVDPDLERPPEALRIYISLFATGLLGIGYEILIVRALSQILENTVFSFAAILSVYLFGTALGGAVYQVWSPRSGFRTVMGRLAKGLCLACMAGTGLLFLVENIYSAVRGWIGQGVVVALAGELCSAAAVFLLPTILMGMTFSHLAQSACGKKGGLGRALSVNTVGAAIAPFLFGVVLLPAIGLKAALALVALGYMMLVPMPASRVQWMTSLVPAGLCVLVFILPLSLKFVTVQVGGKALEYLEGVMASVSVVRDASGHVHLKVNNHYQMGGTSSAYSDRRQAHIPLLLHPSPRRALFLGLGTGATFAAAADHPGLEAVAVELVPEVIDVLPHFEPVTGKLKGHPRLTIKVADARRYVNADRSSYDVIVADLFHPSRDGAGYLYTLEHFQAVKQRLAPGGLFCQWLPLYQLDMAVFKTIVRTFLEVFPEASAFLAHYSLTNPILGLVGGERVIPTEAGWFDQRTGQEILKGRLNDLQLKNLYEFLGCYLSGANELLRFAGKGSLNTDDLPVVMFEAPGFVYTEQEPASHRLLALIDALVPRTADVLPAANDWEGQEIHERLGKYWAARNRFIHAGVGVPCSRDVRQLLSYVREPLIEVVRMSPDFDLAYRPLLAMAQNLVRIDRDAGKSLLASLADANPARSEAQILLDHLPSGRGFSPDIPVQ
jgi:spermidine synthase